MQVILEYRERSGYVSFRSRLAQALRGQQSDTQFRRNLFFLYPMSAVRRETLHSEGGCCFWSCALEFSWYVFFFPFEARVFSLVFNHRVQISGGAFYNGEIIF